MDFDGTTYSVDTGEIVNGFVLREYQNEAIEAARASFLEGKRRVVIVAATGSGKSPIAGQMIKNAIEKNKKVLFLVHRRNLVFQFKEILDTKFNVSCGVIMSQVEFKQNRMCYLASIQTLSRRANLDEFEHNNFMMDFDLIIIDECHRSLSTQYQKVLNMYPDVMAIGFTATPVRADGRGLGEYFDDLLDVVDTGWLMDQGYLSKVRYYVPSEIDLEGIKTVLGDYDKKEIDKRVNTPKLIGDVVSNWLLYGQDRKTIVFAVNVKHSISIRDAFERSGVSAMHLDAKSTDEERDYAFRQMEIGNIKVICNVALYQEGMDVPAISCVIMARPTKSLGLYRQCIGRGLRIYEGKKDLVVLDHGGTVEQNGLVSEKVIWSLDSTKKAYEKKTDDKEKVTKPCKCTVCSAVFEKQDKCPDCGSPIKSFGKPIETKDADLHELDKKKATVADKRQYLGMLKAYVPTLKNPNQKRILGAFKGRFGCWPHHSYKDVLPIEPDAEFLNYQKHLMIKYIKGKSKVVDKLTSQ